MGARRIGAARLAGAIAAPALAVGAVSLAGPAAPAGAVPSSYEGDLTNDGILDRFTLNSGAPCAVHVEPGLRGGGYGAVEVHDFYVPPYAPGSTACPDLAAVVDLGGDGVNELVLAWFHGNIGRPFGGDIIVLHEYEVVATYLAMSMPSAIHTADLNADGLVDIYEDDGNDEPFVSFLNTHSGLLVKGPLQSDCNLAENYLGDFDEDGKADLLIFFHSFCGSPDSPGWGAKVVFDDGTETTIFDNVSEPASDSNWFVQPPADVNGDGHLDVVADDGYTGAIVKTYHGDGQGGFAAAK